MRVKMCDFEECSREVGAQGIAVTIESELMTYDRRLGTFDFCGLGCLAQWATWKVRPEGPPLVGLNAKET